MFFDVVFDILKLAIIGIDHAQIHFDAFLHMRIGKTLEDTFAVALVGDLFRKRRQIVLGVGVDNMCEQLGSLAHQMHPSAQ